MTRAEKQAKLKKGPGVFIYCGGAYDTEATPTVLRYRKVEPVLDGQGFPALDKSGRQIFRNTGDVVRSAEGNPVLGGPPEVKKTEIETYKIWGHEFPRDRKVEVQNEALAFKLRALGCFRETDDAPEAVDPGAPEGWMQKRKYRKRVKDEASAEE